MSDTKNAFDLNNPDHRAAGMGLVVFCGDDWNGLTAQQHVQLGYAVYKILGVDPSDIAACLANEKRFWYPKGEYASEYTTQRMRDDESLGSCPRIPYTPAEVERIRVRALKLCGVRA